MSEVIINGMETVEDPREKTANEIRHMIHSAADVAEMAIRSEDPAVQESMRASARVLLETATKKLDESVGTAVADEEDDE